MATPGPYRVAAPRHAFVGRQMELGRLREAMADARAGHPGVMLIEGPAGIGKSALVAQFLAGLDDVTVLRASGDESERDLWFGVLDQLLRRAGETLPPAGDHVTAGARLLDRLGCLEAEQPVVVVIDDAHWADLPSLRALLFVLRRLVADRVLAIMTTREDPAALPEGLTKAAAGNHVILQPLDRDELHELARAKGVQLTTRAVQRLQAHAGGNPLYTTAVLDEVPADAWHRDDQLPAPRSFATIVRRRLASCSNDAVRLARAVAVLGPRTALIAAASLAQVDRPLETLEEAADAGILQVLKRDGLPAPAFRHPLLAAAVYEQIGPAQRAQLHRAAAELTEDEDAKLRHLAAAAIGPDEALAMRLAKHAERTLTRSPGTAASAMLAAARLSATPENRDQRLMQAVDWMLVSGDAAQARSYADDIAACADGSQRSSILGQYAELDDHIDEAAALFTRAWDQCDATADPVLAAMIAHRNAYHALRSLRDEDVVAWARRALDLAPHDPLAVHWASTLGLSLWRLGRPDEAFQVIEAARTGDEAVDIHLRGQRGWLRYVGDEIETGRADLEAAGAGELRHGALLRSSIRLTVLARLQYAKGEWADAVVSAERALALVSEVEHTPHMAFVWWAVLQVPAARGDWATADTYARRATAEPRDATDRTLAVGMALAVVAAARGDHDAAISALAPVAAMSPNPGIDEPGFSPWHDLYGEALVAAGRAAEADAFLRPHEALAAARGRPSPMAKLARVRGRVEASLGRREHAGTAFGQALEHIVPLGMPYEEALIRYAHGQFLRRNGRRRAAAEQLGSALETLCDLEARPARERCERELASCGLTPAKRTGTPRPDLTPQEEAVARLVATGKTNREVGGELLLSVKTVEMHLTRIYAKLGVSSRAQLAAAPWGPASKE